jgi:hypothetical protein
MINQTRLQAFRRIPKYKYGILVPLDHPQTMEFDCKNGNTFWRDAKIIGMDQIDSYSIFEDHGKGGKPPVNHKKIRCHMVNDIYGFHKARLVADNHLTKSPVDAVYSGVVSLWSLRIVIFIAELNRLELWGADVGNAYFEATTRKKVYIIAGPEFRDREGHILVIKKALHGLRTSGVRWHERFANGLRDLGFFPSRLTSGCLDAEKW